MENNRYINIIFIYFFITSCSVNNSNQDLFRDEDCVQTFCFSYNDSIYKAAMTTNEFCWIFGYNQNEIKQVESIKKWSGNKKDTIFLSQNGRKLLSNFIIPDSTFLYLGNDVEFLLARYFLYHENSATYCFMLDSIDKNAPYNIKSAIMYIMASNGLPMIYDDETGFFYIENKYILVENR